MLLKEGGIMSKQMYVWQYQIKSQILGYALPLSRIVLPTECALTAATMIQKRLDEDEYMLSLVCLGDCENEQ